MPFPPSKKTFEGLIQDIVTRLTLVERRLAVRGGGSSGTDVPVRGTTAARDARYGVPATDAERVSLANKIPLWFNTTTQRFETYYALGSLAGLTVPGLAAGFASGWYGVPTAQWAGKSGPVAWISANKNSWQRGVGSGTLDATTDPNSIIIGLTGIYEVSAHQRGGSASDYIGISLNGDRATLESRAGGVWTHDHSSGGNSFGNSFYLGPLNAGERISAGGNVAGGNIFGGSTTAGALYVKRIA